MTEQCASVFLPAPLLRAGEKNVQELAWAAETQAMITDASERWMRLSDDELWNLMFGPTITRAWHVWSNGHCPICKTDVPMYSWKMDALNHPWKTQCPHCDELFPKNDFLSYYNSGLGKENVFDPDAADRSLLFSSDHPDPDDPLHMFCVDDGEGYVDGEKRWRFIGAYLIYGQWKQAVVDGILVMAEAYVLTGGSAYAHKAAILLDRVADLYPSFDFKEQGSLYEGPGAAGYVSTWHDACEETRRLALAYDILRGAIDDHPELISFLGGKAKQHGLRKKASGADIRQNIEDGILRDALNNREKIHSNKPRTEIACIVLGAVLEWPCNRDKIIRDIDKMIGESTTVNGVTGEKGMANYSAFVIQGMATLLARFERMEPGFLQQMIDRHPSLKDTWRFHIDTWCMQKYYPTCGDSQWFAATSEQYVGVPFDRPVANEKHKYGARTLDPSMFTFMLTLCELTGDAAYVQALYRANDDSLEALPWDIFHTDPSAAAEKIKSVIEKETSQIAGKNVNKADWHLAIVRSGSADSEHVMWLDYDSGGVHAHLDGMNLGLYAFGLDLMPDIGYPPVQFGGWQSIRSRWYWATAAHNTVVVDQANQEGSQFSLDRTTVPGKVTMWAQGQMAKGLRVSGPDMYDQVSQYERSAFMVEMADGRFYLFDVFRVVGGKDHARFNHSHFATITTTGIDSKPDGEFGRDLQMRAFKTDKSPQFGWAVDWRVEDRYGILPEPKDIHLRLTDLTNNAQVSTCEGWVVQGRYDSTIEAWVPRVVTRRLSAEGPLASTFVSVLEPYEGASGIAGIRRLSLTTETGEKFPDSFVGVEVEHVDGTKDLIMAANVEKSGGPMLQTEWGVTTDAEFCLIRRGPDGDTVEEFLG